MAMLFTALLSVAIAVLIYFITTTQGNPTAIWLAGLALACIGAVIIIGFIISIFVVTQTGLIARTAQKIMETGDLSQRIKIDSDWDDLGYMAETLNQLLTRIEELMLGFKTVSDNIAHDLRTPLTRLRNNLETLKKKEGDNPIYEELISEADRLLSTFASLLRIAHIETNKTRALFTDIQIDKMIEDVLELYEPLAEEKQITIKKQIDKMKYHGDRDLLFQAFANLFDNAVKFTPEGGNIIVTLDKHYFSISDSGIGIKDSDSKKIFERFYRSESSRNTPGNGLGLSLVKAVADLHNARIGVSSANPGLRVTITFC
jgi:signal transduction histidine kinase